jgi:hypothetical protein
VGRNFERELWTGTVDWNCGLELWTGTVDWNCGQNCALEL